jgi:hypothetical protein
MICSSVNLDRFIVRLPLVDGLYPNLEEIHGLRSAILASLLLPPASIRADGLDFIGHYTSGDNIFLDIATYTKDGQTVGILGISRTVSITFRKREWNSFIDLWRKAGMTRSDSFQFIGTYKEIDTTYNSLLTMAAGPGVQFTINDKAGTLSFVLSPNDYARFDADVAKVTASATD